MERSKGDAGPPNFTPFKATGLSNKASGERSTGDGGTVQVKKQPTSRVQSTNTEGARSQKMYESKPSSEMSRDTQRVQGKSRPEEKLRSDRATAAKSHQQERDRRDGRENELKHLVQSSGYHQGERGDTSSRGRGRDNWRNEAPHYERGKRGRGRGRGGYQPDLKDYKPPSTDDRAHQRSSVYESHGERGRGRRGRGRGRRGRQDADDDGDSYQPSRPSAGHSLGDWFDQKLDLNKKPSYLSKYQEDYYYSDLYYGWEEPYDSYSHEESRKDGNKSKPMRGGPTEPREEYPPMPSKSSHKSTKQATNQRGQKYTYSEDKGRAGREAWVEEDYPSMPSRPKKPMSQPEVGQGGGGGGGQGHWDWVSLAAGASAPSTALKRTTDT